VPTGTTSFDEGQHHFERSEKHHIAVGDASLIFDDIQDFVLIIYKAFRFNYTQHFVLIFVILYIIIITATSIGGGIKPVSDCLAK